MKKFIFGKKKNVYIIDLEKTAKKLQEARDFARKTAQSGGKILFVATKRQLRGVVQELVSACGMPYVIERWVGGLLTNFSTVRKRINKYLELLEKRKTGGFEHMVKKEVVCLNREIERMERSYRGVATLDDLPDCVFVVDTKKESACVREARKLSIPLIALIDTDADPDVIDYPVPGNDDSIKSVRYIVSQIVEAIEEGLKNAEEIIAAQKAKQIALENKEPISIDPEQLEEEALGDNGKESEESRKRKGKQHDRKDKD